MLILASKWLWLDIFANEAFGSPIFKKKNISYNSIGLYIFRFPIYQAPPPRRPEKGSKTLILVQVY